MLQSHLWILAASCSAELWGPCWLTRREGGSSSSPPQYQFSYYIVLLHLPPHTHTRSTGGWELQSGTGGSWRALGLPAASTAAQTPVGLPKRLPTPQQIPVLSNALGVGMAPGRGWQGGLTQAGAATVFPLNPRSWRKWAPIKCFLKFKSAAAEQARSCCPTITFPLTIPAR